MRTLNFRKQLEGIRPNAVCRVYAVRFTQKGGKRNRAIVLPEQTGKELSEFFWKSISDDKKESEQIEVSGKSMMEKWEELGNLLHNATPYESGNIEEIRKCNLYICEAKCSDEKYYFCSRQNKQIKALLQHAAVVSENESELAVKGLKEICLMNTQVDFIIDPSQNRIVFRDSKSYEQIVGDDVAKEIFVRKNLDIVDSWNFFANIAFTKERVSQKNVYRNLYRIFNREKDLEKMKEIPPAKFKWFLTHKYSEKFTEADFAEEKLIITSHNMEIVLKILAKGIDTVWLIIGDEQPLDEAHDEKDNDGENEDEDETVLPRETVKMCKGISYGFTLEEDTHKSREKQIRHFLAVLDQACKSNFFENSEKDDEEEKADPTIEIFEYFEFNDVKLHLMTSGKETWFEINEDAYQEAYANDSERELLIKGMCTDKFYKLLFSSSKKRE